MPLAEFEVPPGSLKEEVRQAWCPFIGEVPSWCLDATGRPTPQLTFARSYSDSDSGSDPWHAGISGVGLTLVSKELEAFLRYSSVDLLGHRVDGVGLANGTEQRVQSCRER
jgi:hypothetical protein